MTTPGAGSLEEGTRLGDVQVRSRLHTTASGSVYEAVQAGLGRDVVLAVPDAPADSEAGRRFMALAGRLTAVNHPHVLALYDVREDGDRLIAAQRAGSGPRVDTALAGGPLDPAAAVSVIEQLASAVAALERAGVGTLVPTARTVVLDGTREAPQARFAATEALLEPIAADTGATAAFGDLLAELTTGRGAPRAQPVPAALRPVVERASKPGNAYPTPSALAAAARAAVPATRRAPSTRGPIVAVVVLALLAAAAALAVVLIDGTNERPARRPALTASANAPAARIAATIPVGGVPVSTAVDATGVWVGRTDGMLVHVDPRTRRVVGSPVRFGTGAPDANITVRAGAGAIWATDGHSGIVARVDPRTGRITDRVRAGGTVSAMTGGGKTLWLVRRAPRHRQDGLVRFDTATLRQVGASVPVGLGALDIEVSGPVAWISDSRTGVVTRYDSRTGARRAIIVGTGVGNSALRDGVLWAPDLPGGTVTPIDAARMRLPARVARPDHPIAVVPFGDALWAMATADWFDPDSPARLFRIDPRTGRTAGRPVALGPHAGWPVPGAGAIWVPAQDRHALYEIVPAPAAPGLGPSPAAPRGVLATGPGPVGTAVARAFGDPFSLRIDRPGWVVQAVDHDGVGLADSARPAVAIIVGRPTQVFDSAGAVHAVRTPAQVVRAIRANRALETGPTLRRRIGGVPATGFSIKPRAGRPVPPFCVHACVPMLGWEHNTVGPERGTPARIWLFQHGGRVMAIGEAAPDERSLAETSALVDTLRFTR